MTTDILITKAGEEPGAASFKVEVTAARVQRAEHQATKSVAQRVRLPGFRKGKAPLAVVRKRYHDAIREQVLREVIGEGWKATLAQEALEPIADPHVHGVRFEAGAPLTFELRVELKPALQLDRLGGFTLERRVAPVTDEMVETQLADLRNERANWIPVEAGRPQSGEMVSVTLTTLTGDDEGDPRQYQIVLGEGQAIPDVEDAIMTLDVGATTEASVRFPEDFPDETKRGQSRTVQLTLHEVKRLDLPILDDAFAREIGDFDTVDALRGAVRKDLELEARREADGAVRHQLIDLIVAANAVPTPRPLVERLMDAYRRAYRIPDEEVERFLTEFRPIAEAQVRRDLIVDRVAASEQLAATEEEIDQRVADIARRRNAEPGEVYAQLQKAKRLREIEQAITEDKVYDHLFALSTVTDS
ncbi:MAG TPA: trigger factor [Gemmatimonadales bacterium]